MLDQALQWAVSHELEQHCAVGQTPYCTRLQTSPCLSALYLTNAKPSQMMEAVSDSLHCKPTVLTVSVFSRLDCKLNKLQSASSTVSASSFPIMLHLQHAPPACNREFVTQRSATDTARLHFRPWAEGKRAHLGHFTEPSSSILLTGPQLATPTACWPVILVSS